MSSRPNIVFIMTDHTSAEALRPESGCLTPNLSALAADGMRLERFYTTNAICSPARASLMTGQYPSTHGVWDCTHTQRPEWVDVRRDALFWSMALERAGYRNAYYGKWHVEQSGKLESFGWPTYDAGIGGCRLRASDSGPKVVSRQPGYREGTIAGVADLPADPRHPAFEAGIAFICEASRSDAPFCCFISASEPHDPYIPARRFFELYDPARLPLSPSLRDGNEDKPEVTRRMAGIWDYLSDDDWRLMRTCYFAVISFLDREAGRVLAALKECGADKNTIVVFTSDHGDMMGGHGLAAKGITPYEEVYNIPLVLRAPGMPALGARREMAGMVDLGPTLLDLCGVDPLPAAQGRSMRPILEGRADPAQWQDAYAEFFGQRFVYTQRLVWHGDWKYVFSPGGKDELYNLSEDPFERRNRIGDPSCRSVVEDMCRRMWRKMQDIGDTSLLNTHYTTLRTAPLGPLSIET